MDQERLVEEYIEPLVGDLKFPLGNCFERAVNLTNFVGHVIRFTRKATMKRISGLMWGVTTRGGFNISGHQTGMRFIPPFLMTRGVSSFYRVFLKRSNQN
jgi:hypothetical protein